MKFGFRTPSLKKSIAARTSSKRFIKNALGIRAPKGMGWVTNPKKAAYNTVYNKTTKGCLTVLVVPIFLGGLLAAFLSCGNNTEVEQPKIPAGIEYKITKNVVDKSDNRYLTNVEINKIIDTSTIRIISDYIKATHTEVPNMRMFFSIKGLSNGAWARVDYLPTYDLEIFGADIIGNQNLETASLKGIEDKEIIGMWKDLSSFATRTLIISKKNDGYQIRWFYKDGSFQDVKLKLQRNKFKVVERELDEWYIIEANGNLGTYSSKGKFSEATPVN